MMRRAMTALALSAALLASGCGFHGIYSLPLPGAVANGSNTYTVDVQFADVLDLVPYSAVKVDGATVGHVSTITYQRGHALVGCKMLDTVKLPANAIARVEQTSVLGEKFVEIEPPTNATPTGRLVGGMTIPLQRTDTDASVEEVLGALSALINDGGVAQIHTIAHEISTALTGRTAVSRDLLSRLRDFSSGLNNQKQDILRALSGVDTLSRTVHAQEGELVTALDDVPPALRILTGDRRQLTTMLVAVQHLGHVAVHVINASRAGILTNLRNLRPTLDKLGEVGSVIPKTLGIIITYPTADSVENEYFGDYGNLSLTIDLSKQSLQTFLEGTQLTTVTNPTGTSGTHRSTSAHHATSHPGHHKVSLHNKLKKVVKKITHVLPPGGLSGLLGLPR